MSQLLKELTFIGGVDIGDDSDGSGDSGLYLLSLASSVLFAIAIVARMLKGFGRFKSFRLGGTIGNCRPKPYAIVGSFESSSIVTICGSGDAIDDIEIISRVSSPDISVELRTIGVLRLGMLWSLEDCST